VSGTIEHIDPVIDATSGTFRIIVAIPPSPQATPGLSAMLIVADSTKPAAPERSAGQTSQ
ncbi:MAG TPA: hypothetical protein PLN52_23860, partial [Opitutaceae bacterium]|nr:hypothetical protein [Opitutaceae bacterium]